MHGVGRLLQPQQLQRDGNDFDAALWQPCESHSKPSQSQPATQCGGVDGAVETSRYGGGVVGVVVVVFFVVVVVVVVLWW